MDELDNDALNIHLFIQKEGPVWALKLSSAPATAETWNFRCCTLRVNAPSCTFIAQEFMFIDLVPLFRKICQKTDFIAEHEDAFGLRYISYISSD